MLSIIFLFKKQIEKRMYSEYEYLKLVLLTTNNCKAENVAWANGH